jgi:hypothetical protein
MNLGKFGFNPKTPTGYQHVLMAEMIVALGIIGVRAVSDYVPAGDSHNPGSEHPVKGQSPVVLITATLAVYFVLSFLATRGGWAAKSAAAFGLLMIAGLMINSEAELVDVAHWIENIGTNAANQPPIKTPNDNLPSAPAGGNNDPKKGKITAPTTGPGSPSDPLS